METRVAVISIIVQNKESVPDLNSILSEFGDCIIGRMGIPYHKKSVSIISIALDAEQSTIDKLNEKIERLSGVQAKTAYGNI